MSIPVVQAHTFGKASLTILDEVDAHILTLSREGCVRSQPAREKSQGRRHREKKELGMLREIDILARA